MSAKIKNRWFQSLSSRSYRHTTYEVSHEEKEGRFFCCCIWCNMQCMGCSYCLKGAWLFSLWLAFYGAWTILMNLMIVENQQCYCVVIWNLNLFECQLMKFTTTFALLLIDHWLTDANWCQLTIINWLLLIDWLIDFPIINFINNYCSCMPCFLLHNEPTLIGSNKSKFQMSSNWSLGVKGEKCSVSADVHLMTLKCVCIWG